MRSRRGRRGAIAAWLAFVCLGSVYAGSFEEGVAAEIERLRERVATAEVPSANWPGLKERLEQTLDEIAADVDAGRALYGLHQLTGSQNTTVAYLYREGIAADGEIVEATFASEWEQAETTLLGRAPALPKKGAALVAIAEAARMRMRVYYDASRAMATASSPADGMFYLGRAQAYREFLTFCRSLHQGDVGKMPRMRSWQSELEQLDSAVLAAFQPPRSIEEHPDFIQLSATMKLAHELNDAEVYDGALYKYLEATTLFQRMGGVGGDAGALREKARAFATRVADDKRDHSIAQIFVEQAQSALASDAPEEADLATAQAVLSTAIPAYFAAIDKKAPRGRTADDAVHVTLVRWPYT